MKVRIAPHIKHVFWTDIEFWRENREEITSWLSKHGCRYINPVHGFFEYRDDQQLALFLLRWA